MACPQVSFVAATECAMTGCEHPSRMHVPHIPHINGCSTPHTHPVPLRTPQVGEFGGDNRAGIDRTLHRISCMRNRTGRVIGLTCRVGRAIKGSASIVHDLVLSGAGRCQRRWARCSRCSARGGGALLLSRIIITGQN